MLTHATLTADPQTSFASYDREAARHEPAPASQPTAATPLAPVTVVIVNHNAGHVLVDCLESALVEASEVVLVDNASQPERFEPLIAGLEAHPRLHVIRSTENRGFAAGCNLGSEIATQPLILFLNPDCVFATGSLARLCVVLQEHPRAGMAGGLLTYPDGREQGGGRRAVPTPWRSFVRAFGLARLCSQWPTLFNDFHLHRQPLPQAAIEVEAISGACMLVKREAIDDFGLMDEGYFLHCEDLDLCMRARAHGWQIIFVPDVPIIHHKGGCSKERPVFVEWHKHRGMVRFYRKHFQHQYPSGLMELVILGVWLRFAVVATRKQISRLWQRAGSPRRQPLRTTRSQVELTPLDASVMPIVISSRPVIS